MNIFLEDYVNKKDLNKPNNENKDRFEHSESYTPIMLFSGVTKSKWRYERINKFIENDIKINWKNLDNSLEIKKFDIIFNYAINKVIFLSICSMKLYKQNIDSYVLHKSIRFLELGSEYDEVLNSICKDLNELKIYINNEFESEFQMLLAFEKYAFENLSKDLPILEDYYIQRWYNNVINEINVKLTFKQKLNLIIDNFEDKHYYFFRIFYFICYIFISFIFILIGCFITIYLNIL